MSNADRPSFVVPVEEPAEPAPAVASASVIVARDGAGGLEVFMLERHLKSDFAGGAYVFPGGKLDPGDADPGLAGLIDGMETVAADLGEQEDAARAVIVCAVREAFEEAGVLLARTPDGRPVRLAEERRDEWLAYRRALQAGELSALEAAQRGGIRFDAGLLRFWARWVTPVQSPRRYDTRFFVALMPEGQTPLHDDVEATASTWIRPEDAIRQALSGERSIIFPTRKMLESLAPYASARALFDAAVGRPSAPVLPRIVFDGGEPRVVLPDGSSHAP